MEASVLHQPRIAFDAASVLVDVSTADESAFAWYGEHLAALLGPSLRRDLLTTRHELLHAKRDNTRNVEGGKWRVRLEDALRTRPEVAESLRELTLSARSRRYRSRG